MSTDSKAILADFELFCQLQLYRLKLRLAERLAQDTSPTASVTFAREHATGPRKPSLSELEKQGQTFFHKRKNQK
jgi:hypothetical protein